MKKSTILKAVLALGMAITASADDSKGPVLFIGDSHSTADFGWTLDALLRKTVSPETWSYASCGSSPGNWSKAFYTNCGFWMRKSGEAVPLATYNRITPKYDDIAARLNPKLTVIALGANLVRPLVTAPGAAGEAIVYKELTTMLKAQKERGGACAWVGPPDFVRPYDTTKQLSFPADPAKLAAATRARIKDFYRILGRATKDAGSSCAVIDSTACTVCGGTQVSQKCPLITYAPIPNDPPEIPKDPQAVRPPDGIHYSGTTHLANLAVAWGHCACQQIGGQVSSAACQQAVTPTPPAPLGRDVSEEQILPPVKVVGSAGGKDSVTKLPGLESGAGL